MDCRSICNFVSIAAVFGRKWTP